MPDVESIIPDVVIERSLGLKTTVIVIGALLLLLSTYVRPDYPVLWVIPFLLGVLIEWLIVATVYVEISQIESEIDQARDEIERALREVGRIQNEVEDVQSDVTDIKDDIFSFISDSQGIGVHDSLEDRISNLEDAVETGRYYGSDDLETRVWI